MMSDMRRDVIHMIALTLTLDMIFVTIIKHVVVVFVASIEVVFID